MSDTDSPQNQRKPFSHTLSWIAMIAMAAMCLLTLVYAASLNIG
ncbi:MAG: hypothetical protein ACM3Q1_06615 [Bacteroidales bacterium]